MRALQKKVEAMEKVGAGALADQALRKLIRLHLQKYEKQLAEVQRELEPFEDRKSTRLNSSHIQKSRMPSSA